MISNSTKIQNYPLNKIRNYKRKLRKLGKRQLEKTIQLIQETGFPPVVLIDKNNSVITGQVFIDAARAMKFETVPVIQIDSLGEDGVRILRLALDRLRDEESWIEEVLSEEIQELHFEYPELDLCLTGFEVAEIDTYLDFNVIDPVEQIPEVSEREPITKEGDLWLLGKHKLYCGDSKSKNSYQAVLGNKKADIVLSDPPYNVPIDGHVCGNGKIKHREFKVASGEMSAEQFIEFLQHIFKNMIEYSAAGSLHYIFMDWRHSLEILTAAKDVEYEHKNICIWVKDNGGMGSLYRSRHEMVHIFKKKGASHQNNIELGKYGRYRTNVWEYPGVNSFGGAQKDLELHPTVKPVALLMDAIKDCSKPNDIVLDPFGGSGSTLIAAEKSNRKSCLIEIDPHYCDVIIRRWQDLSGQEAIHSKSKKSYGAIMGANNE